LNYNDLKSIVSSKKTTFTMSNPTRSFYVVSRSTRAYIEPTFTKQDFGDERPRILLISAVGASGKSALASQLSADTALPLFDLGIHPPVADNTLTGLLTNSFPIEDLSSLLTALKSGSYGAIIDGIDEGRSKVNESAFNAFLENLLKLSEGSDRTTFVLLGRTQALIDCWVYLQERGATVGLASIDPFSQHQAVRYIDTFSEPPSSGDRALYDSTRDSILAKLARAFSGEAIQYLNFIGYPPVLDAIATLLREEKNYYKLNQALAGSSGEEVESSLLYKIASYILDRERLTKILPNILSPLIADFPISEQATIRQAAFNYQEQSARLLAYVLKVQYKVEVIPQQGLNAKYEEQITPFLAEHPFLVGGAHEFRNAVFEAVCLATLIASDNPNYVELVSQYVAEHRSSLYVIQMLDQIAPGGSIDASMMHVLISAALEFKSTKSSAEVTVEPLAALDGAPTHEPADDIQLDVIIEIVRPDLDEPDGRFSFRARVSSSSSVFLGSKLSACTVEMPCEVILSGGGEVELTAPVEINASKISLATPSLLIKAQPRSDERHVILEAHQIGSSLTSLSVENGADFAVRVADKSGFQYPLLKYVKAGASLPALGDVKAKYLKLRKILTHFRSHSRGTLAKLHAKIENERVAGNEIGKPILARLERDSILIPDGKFYFLQPANVDKFLGVSWMRLKEGDINDKLVDYLRSID
jgi:hypothetical protein